MQFCSTNLQIGPYELQFVPTACIFEKNYYSKLPVDILGKRKPTYVLLGRPEQLLKHAKYMIHINAERVQAVL